MGVEALVGGLFGLASAGVQAASASHVQSANAAAQANLNAKTMQFNREEALKARNFSSAEALKERNFNAEQAEISRQFNQEQILAARMFEERMANTAHQREVDDLRRAGLNPILSATGGNGAAVPVAPIISSPAASQSGAPAGHAASVSGLQAYKRDNYMGAFANTALDAMRTSSDLMKAKAHATEAEAALKRAETEAKESVQRIEESISRVGLNYDEHELNQIRKMKEEDLVKLVREQIETEILRRSDQHELSKAQKDACLISANAYAGLASAQANLAHIRGELETAKNPSVINELNKQADHYQSEIDKNKWIMTDPEEIAKRAYWEGNPSAAGVEHFSKVLGNVVHGSISISRGSFINKKGR